MSSLTTRPLLAVSLLFSSVILLGYLWQKRRSDDFNRDEAEQTKLESSLGAIDSHQVSLKLESLSRSRLDCIEEERVEEHSEDKTKNINRQRSSTEKIEQNIGVIDSVGTDSAVAFAQTIIPPKSPYSPLQIGTTDHSTLAMESMEENLQPESVSQASVPESISALKDPVCSLSTSPVKSESSDSQRSSEAWSDLMEQDEQEVQEVIIDKCLSEKIADLEVAGRGSARNDSGVASPTEDYHHKQAAGMKDADSKSRISSGEDAGIGGSETGDVSDGNGELCLEETQLLAYHFHIQDYLCGTFIGAGGASINKLKSTCNCNIIVKDDHSTSNQKRVKVKSRDRKYGEGKLNLCIIEGTRSNIDKCLDIIKEKFSKHPELTLEQINKSENRNLALFNGSVTLSLAEGIMHDVYISAIVNGGHVFIQQPAHPTFPALERLDSCMYNTYSQLPCPELAKPILPNSICVVSNNDGWYRCQVVGYNEIEDVCDIKYIDYGGYDTVPACQMRQIRTDFLSLPFQAIECNLANIILTEENTVSANILEELVAGQIVQARMIGFSEDGVPMIHLYRASNGQTVLVNRELVDRSCADWIEATIVPLNTDTLGN